MGLYVLETAGDLPLVVGGAVFADKAAADKQKLEEGVIDLTEIVRPLGANVLQAAHRHDQEALVSAMVVDHLFETGLHPDTDY